MDIRLPIKATPYRHQIEAFLLVCALFDIVWEDACGYGGD